MNNNRIPDALRLNRIRCVLAIVVCVLLCVFVFLAVTDQLLRDPDPLVKEVGWKSYHMFTVLSNMLMAVAAAMCVPFAVDGMRYRNYHLPRWYVNLMFTGTSCVALTFLIALTVLSPAAGFYRMMLFSNNILFHTICPLLSIALFFFINSDHRIPLKASVIAILPVALYSLVYLLMVFVIGEAAGGWRDHYQIRRITEFLPLPVVLLLLCLISFGLANLLRVVHNWIHRKRKEDLERYYQQAEAFSYPDIQTAIRALADMDRPHDLGGELTVPRRIIAMMEKKYQSGLSTRALCETYLRAYFQDEKEKQ